MNFIVHCIISFFAVIIYVTGEKDETLLLLNESDSVQGRLNRMENTLATLNKVVQQQSWAIQQQSFTIQEHGAAIQKQGTIIQQQRTIMKVQKKEIRQLQYDKGTGSTYVIWGRKQCPNITDTEQVYSGYVGGGYNEQAGSSSQYVCLPPDPDFQRTNGEEKQLRLQLEKRIDLLQNEQGVTQVYHNEEIQNQTLGQQTDSIAVLEKQYRELQGKYYSFQLKFKELVNSFSSLQNYTGQIENELSSIKTLECGGLKNHQEYSQ
ncbi:unnamed protein product [Mytilus coruscus]|uniref:Uncharacterized protein n=1 Tax=Mytilus coruscus TaxID=42192 RepID=A0A6J8B9Y0_MYTCO|nr:unnamed protein product [Mytilus coruscus]